MIHPEEHTLELYVLNAESVTSRRAEIEEHLRACAGCKALVGEISLFYTELDRELQKSDAREPLPGERRLAKRNADLAVWEERLTMGPLAGWGTPVKKLRYYIRRYPIAAAGTTFAFASLAIIGLVMGYRNLSKDVDPDYVVLNQTTGFFEVYNTRNDLLWKRILPNASITIAAQHYTEIPRYAVEDIDGDGRSEVLTPLVLGGEPALPTTGLHVFDGEGNVRDIVFERKITFRGVPYEMPVRIGDGTLLFVDTTDPREPEIFVTVKNDRSPNAIVRMNGRGEVLGEFWHHGHFAGFYPYDVEGDGRTELIVCGFNDVDDRTGPSHPVFMVLDPRKIVGRQESQLTPGYGYEKSAAEKYYVRLPLTEINILNKVNAGMSRFRVHGDRFVFLWNFQNTDNLHYDLDFVFSGSLEPLRVVPPTQIKQLFDREYESKRISTRLDDAYLEYLRSQVRFWDGKAWRQEAVMVASGPQASSTE